MVALTRSFNRLNLLSLFLIGIIQVGPLSGSQSSSISFSHDKIYLKKALTSLVEEHNVAIIFPDNVPNITVTANCDECTDAQAVEAILYNSNLVWDQTGNQFTIILDKVTYKYGVSGQVLDKDSNGPIPYGNVYISNLNIGDITDRDGMFSIPNISAKSCTLIISYISYETQKLPLHFPTDQNDFIEIFLSPKVLSSKRISILGEPREFMDRSDNPGQISFSPRHISTLPNLGEVDIFRSLQFLPGVQLGLGGTSGLYIRGGTPDQNLILLDGMPIYQTGHMFGFISAISADAIKDIQVYKGSIPAKYGGRVSSVIELTTKNGNSLKPQGSFYGNILSQGASVELPILSRGSWIINFRRSANSAYRTNLYQSIQDFLTGDDNCNLIGESANKSGGQQSFYSPQSSYQDIISRLSFLVTPIHRLTVTKITGIDSIREDREYYGFNSIWGYDSTKINELTEWKNDGLSINWSSKWNHESSSHLQFSRYLYSSNYYSNQYLLRTGNLTSNIGSSIENNYLEDRSIRFKNTYKGLKNHKIETGFEETYYTVRFENNKLDGLITNKTVFKQDGFLHSFHFDDKWKPSPKLDINAGYRISYYNELQGFYRSPRFALSYKAKPNLSVEASLGRHHQFVHRITGENTTRGTGRMWIISNNLIPCVSSMNYHAGINWAIPNYSMSVDGYYRSLIDLFELENSFIPASALMNSSVTENNAVKPGSGTAQGLEILFRKKTGPLTGWVSYHLNKTIYNFPDLNDKTPFLAGHDKTHELKSVVMTRIKNWDLTVNWVFASGRVFTDISNMYVNSGYIISTSKDHNIKRLEPIHHLDISISKILNIYTTTVHTGVSIYNLYNKLNVSHKRDNPYTSELTSSDVAMFGITPTAFVKISF